MHFENIKIIPRDHITYLQELTNLSNNKKMLNIKLSLMKDIYKEIIEDINKLSNNKLSNKYIAILNICKEFK